MNIVKKIEKAKNNQLKEGEHIHAALTLNDAGAISKAAVSGGVGGLIGLFAGSKMQKKTDSKNAELESSAMSQQVPTGLSVLGVTDNRILAYSFDQISGKAKELKAEFQRGDVSFVEYEPGKLAGRLVLSFKDGGKRAFDVPRGNNVDAFKASLSS